MQSKPRQHITPLKSTPIACSTRWRRGRRSGSGTLARRRRRPTRRLAACPAPTGWRRPPPAARCWPSPRPPCSAHLEPHCYPPDPLLLTPLASLGSGPADGQPLLDGCQPGRLARRMRGLYLKVEAAISPYPANKQTVLVPVAAQAAGAAAGGGARAGGRGDGAGRRRHRPRPQRRGRRARCVRARRRAGGAGASALLPPERLTLARRCQGCCTLDPVWSEAGCQPTAFSLAGAVQRWSRTTV
jgi:hypothetical protein